MHKKEKIIIGLCIVITIIAGILHYTEAPPVIAFIVTAAALALLALIVGDATEQLGSRFGPAATGSVRDLIMLFKRHWLAQFWGIHCLFLVWHYCWVAGKTEHKNSNQKHPK
jgi:hypothetical protein